MLRPTQQVWSTQSFTLALFQGVLTSVVAHFSQLKAYRRRKNLLFIRMKFGTILMCCTIIFLTWLQDWLPKKEKQFWSRGKSFSDDIQKKKIHSVLKQKVQDLDFE